uniref:Uncharacterized protein n=1 Tax=Triticum urartu TaxID=4572 RepID=A0A8R7U9I6_TRIUA
MLKPGRMPEVQERPFDRPLNYEVHGKRVLQARAGSGRTDRSGIVKQNIPEVPLFSQTLKGVLFIWFLSPGLTRSVSLAKLQHLMLACLRFWINCNASYHSFMLHG